MKTGFKWLAIVVCSLLTVVLLVAAVINWRAGACLDAQLQSVRQAGEPLTLVDLGREPTSPERNAVTYLRRAEKSVEAVNQELSVLGTKHDDYYEKERLNHRGIKLVESALVAYPDILPLIEQAANAPDYVPDHDYTLPPEDFLSKYLDQVQRLRAFGRFLQYRGDLLLARQEREESLRNGLMLLRLVRHAEREPMTIAYLVSVAVRSIAIAQIARCLDDGPVSSELHDALDKELYQHLQSPAYVDALRGERVYGIESFRNIRSVTRGLWYFKQDECDYLRRLAAEIEIGTTPRYKAEPELARMKVESKQARRLTALVIPALEAAREANQRSRAHLQCLLVLNALSRDTHEAGAGTPRVDDLQLADEIKVDPYNGEPLHIKKAKAGWIVYSVGENLKDDGGIVDNRHDIGVGPEG